MKQELKYIVKVDYMSDIWRSLNNIIRDVGDTTQNELKTVYNENNEMEAIDLIKKVSLKFNMDNPEQVTLTTFKDNLEALEYLKSLLVQFQGRNAYLYDIKNRIKELKLYSDSLKANKIKELVKGETILKLNDLLYTSWGYDQTNTEHFKVLKIIGKNYFIIQEIGQKTVEGSESFMSCSVVPDANSPLNKLPIKAFIDNKGYMSISEDGYKRGLFKCKEGSGNYKSWYA